MPVRYLSWIAGFNRAENRLGVKVQLCTLPWLGWIPDGSGCGPDCGARPLGRPL